MGSGATASERIDALLQVALRIARSAPSGRIALARVAERLHPAWITEPWATELDGAREAAYEPLGRRDVERALREAWGGKPTSELDELDLEPIAVTAIAQVHRGVRDGSEVAVKVLRPGLARTVRQDLALLDGLLAPLAAALPALDARGLLREVRERVLDELDLEHEAAVQRRFHRALRGHPFLTVPAPHTALARAGVTVSDWVDGTPIAQAADPDTAAARWLVFVLGAWRIGAVHADPREEDALVLRDGRLAILDFGATRAVDPGRLAGVIAAVEAFAARDEDGFATAVSGLGYLPADRAPDALELLSAALAELGEPGVSRLDGGALAGVRERAHARGTVSGLLPAAACPPEDLWPLRGAAQLFCAIGRVGASADWLALTRAALWDGWDAALRLPRG